MLTTPPVLRRLLSGRPVTRIRPGLERIAEMLGRLGNPERRFRSLHVAGTNGKGSVASSVAAILGRRRTRVGLFTSPHLVDFRERIRIDGSFVPEPVLEACATRLMPIADRVEATYFEVATALAFLCFAESGVEEAVVETGMGGRWDATNVLAPAVCAITSIAVDHVEFLGSSIASIAREKAGILKAGVPAVTAPLPPAALLAVEEAAERCGATLRVLERDAQVESVAVDAAGTEFVYRSARHGSGLRLRTNLIGRHQAQNAGLAVLALESWPGDVDPEDVREGLAAVDLPGRFHSLTAPGGRWLLDIAHNAEAVDRLVETLEDVRPPRPVVALVAVLSDKPWPAMAGALARACDAAVLTIAPSSPPERRWKPGEAVKAALQSEESWPAEARPNFDDAVQRARELAGAGTVLVTGSAHTVGDALALLTD